MGDRPWILAGLAVFLLLVTGPIWAVNLGAAGARGPDLTPPSAMLGVFRHDTTSSAHVRLMLRWVHEMNTDVLERHGTFTASDGKVYPFSLERSFLSAPGSAEYCTTCHTSVGASPPSCLSCHNNATVVTGRAP